MFLRSNQWRYVRNRFHVTLPFPPPWGTIYNVFFSLVTCEIFCSVFFSWACERDFPEASLNTQLQKYLILYKKIPVIFLFILSSRVLFLFYFSQAFLVRRKSGPPDCDNQFGGDQTVIRLNTCAPSGLRACQCYVARCATSRFGGAARGGGELRRHTGSVYLTKKKRRYYTSGKSIFGELWSETNKGNRVCCRESNEYQIREVNSKNWRLLFSIAVIIMKVNGMYKKHVILNKRKTQDLKKNKLTNAQNN